MKGLYCMQKRQSSITVIRSLWCSLIIYAVIATCSTVQAQAWNPVGNPAFTSGRMNDMSFALDRTGTPYIAYTEGPGSLPVVKKYIDSYWVDVGIPHFSISSARFISIAIDSAGTPYVAYQDGSYGPATVMRYIDSNWVPVGSPGFTGTYISCTSIAIDRSGVPYIVFQDGMYGRATVMRYIDSNWEYVGAPGFTPVSAYSTCIVLDKNNTPYVAYNGIYSGPASVMKYNGSSWVAVGSGYASFGDVASLSIALDTNGNPYIAYVDDSYGEYPAVTKYDGSNWDTVGSYHIFSGHSDYTSIAIDRHGTPYVVYEDINSYNRATVKKYNGSSWVQVGDCSFSEGRAYANCIVIDSAGTPYVAYGDDFYEGKAVVMKLDSFPGLITGTGLACVGATTTLSDITSGGTWSSANTGVADIDTTGVVTGVAAGTAVISYVVSGSTTVFTVTINPLPAVGMNTTGYNSICVGNTMNLYSSIVGEWYSMYPAVATVTTDGHLVGVTSGVDTVICVVSNMCRSDSAYYPIWILPCANGVNNLGYPTITSLTAFPNPSHGSFTLNISSPQKENATIIITNILGEKMKEFIMVTNTDIDVQLNAAPGVYFVTTITSQDKECVKVIIE